MRERFEEHIWFMQMALEEANKAYLKGEVPVGAVCVGAAGNVLSRSHNLKESTNNPTAHAEILSLQEGARVQGGSWRLTGARLYVTLEPCLMCLGALVQARVEAVIFGAYDPKGGALSLGYQFYKDQRLNHRFSVMGGVYHFECGKILSDFFKSRRNFYRSGLRE